MSKRTPNFLTDRIPEGWEERLFMTKKLRIKGATVKEVKLKPEGKTQKKAQKTVQQLLKEANLGNTSRNKRRFTKEQIKK